MWWENMSEELTILILGVICIVALFVSGTEGPKLVGPIAGGLVGYLTRGFIDKRNEK